MKTLSTDIISRTDFKKAGKLAKDAYNIAVIVDYFVSNQPEIEECYNLAPVIKLLKHNVDLLNIFFTDAESIEN